MSLTLTFHWLPLKDAGGAYTGGHVRVLHDEGGPLVVTKCTCKLADYAVTHRDTTGKIAHFEKLDDAIGAYKEWSAFTCWAHETTECYKKEPGECKRLLARSKYWKRRAKD